MTTQSIRAGFRGMARRPGLILLLFALNLLPAFALSLPVRSAFEEAVGMSGFGEALAAGFDLTLWAEFFRVALELMVTTSQWMLLVVPLYFAAKTAAQAGLVHALRGDQRHAFWQGVRRFTGRSLLLALLFGLLAGAWILATLFLTGTARSVWSGWVGVFWVYVILLPTLLVAGLLVLDLLHDYAVVMLVVEERGVWEAFTGGIGWVLRQGSARGLYLFWMLPAGALVLLPTLLDMSTTAATTRGIWILFLVQQAVLLLRAATAVGWIGSEVALFETIRPPSVARPDGEGASPIDLPEEIDLERPGAL